MTDASRPVLKTRAMQVVEIAHGEPIDSLLRRLYLTDCLTQAEIAERLGLTGDGEPLDARGGEVPVLGPRRRSVA